MFAVGVQYNAVPVAGWLAGWLAGCQIPRASVRVLRPHQQGMATGLNWRLTCCAVLCCAVLCCASTDVPAPTHPRAGDGCNVLRLPPDLAGHLTSTSDTFLCPNCLAGVHQVGAPKAAACWDLVGPRTWAESAAVQPQCGLAALRRRCLLVLPPSSALRLVPCSALCARRRALPIHKCSSASGGGCRGCSGCRGCILLLPGVASALPAAPMPALCMPSLPPSPSCPRHVAPMPTKSFPPSRRLTLQVHQRVLRPALPPSLRGGGAGGALCVVREGCWVEEGA